MIKENEISITLNKREQVNYYSKLLNKPYNLHDTIAISPYDLLKGSHVIITGICDICGKEKEMMYKTYMVCTDNLTRPYYCANHTLDRVKAELQEKYGVTNVFQLEEIKEKSKQTCLNKYGVGYNSQRPEFKEKFLLGDNNYFSKFSRKQYVYDNNTELKEWRSKIYSKFDCTCQICGARRDEGAVIQAHHLWGYFDFPEKRYEVDNGITLCAKHHLGFHWIHQDDIITPDLFWEYAKG